MPNVSRPNKQQYWLDILHGIAARSTCPRRSTAAIIVDEENHLLASGYNGSPKGIPNCTNTPCGGQNDESGNTSRCVAIHAEQNAILQAGDRLRYATKMYCTTFPCFVCAKLICQTKIDTIIFIDDYPDDRSHALLKRAGIKLVKGVA